MDRQICDRSAYPSQMGAGSRERILTLANQIDQMCHKSLISCFVSWNCTIWNKSSIFFSSKDGTKVAPYRIYRYLNRKADLALRFQYKFAKQQVTLNSIASAHTSVKFIM